MTDIIHLLPDSVANQIAAGEVIQRPASVIKELVENSIDAGASMVQVLVTDAGRTCIQVIDNGKGMSETDARLSFERHATSKIQKADDLFALHTMGFRGEALASIAAIAEVELRTRRPEDDLGVSITIEGSRITSQEPISCPAGANFAVRNLFYNIPVRRKFLKGNRTELANILSEFERIAIAHPNVAFTLSHNEEQMLNLPAGNFHQRVLGLFGKRIDSKLLPVQTDTDLVRISGFVGTPESAKKKSAHQFFVTNSRYMRHPYFTKAIQTAYERLIPDGYQVPFFLCLEVEPSQIDVNVHPTKTEIKFTDEQDIWHILLVAIREALGKHNAIPSLDFTAADRPDIPIFAPSAGTGGSSAPQPPTIHINPNFNPFSAGKSKPAVQSGWEAAYNLDDLPSIPTDHPTLQADFAGSLASISRLQPNTSDLQANTSKLQANTSRLQASLPIDSALASSSPTLFGDLPAEEASVWTSTDSTYYQYQGQYILTSAEQGLLLIDQNRASQRILYDQYRHRMTEGTSATQGLLFMQIIQLSPSQAHIAESIGEDLDSLGFNISNLGGGSFSILGVPAGTEGLDPVALLQTILDDAEVTMLSSDKDNSNAARETLHHTLAASMARKAATPIGESLSTKEMKALCDALFASSLPGYAPDGKPIIVTLSPAHIARLFS